MIDPNSPHGQEYINSMNTPEYKQMLIDESQKKVREARNALYVISAFTVVGGVFLYYTDDISGQYILIASLVIAAIFAGLALLVNKKPRLAVLSGLILYCALWLIDIIDDPAAIIRGIFVKIFIIYFLVKGFKAAKEVEETRGKLENMKEADKPLDQI